MQFCCLTFIEDLKIICLNGLEEIFHKFRSIFPVTLRLFESKSFLKFSMSSLTLISWYLGIEKSISIELRHFPCLRYSILCGAKIRLKTFWSFDWCLQIVILERSIACLSFLYGKSHEESGKWNWKIQGKFGNFFGKICVEVLIS